MRLTLPLVERLPVPRVTLPPAVRLRLPEVLLTLAWTSTSLVGPVVVRVAVPAPLAVTKLPMVSVPLWAARLIVPLALVVVMLPVVWMAPSLVTLMFPPVSVMPAMVWRPRRRRASHCRCCC